MFCGILKRRFTHYYVWFMDKKDGCTVGEISKLNWCKHSYFPVKEDNETVNTQAIYQNIVSESGCREQTYTNKQTGYTYLVGDNYEYEVYNILRNIVIRIDEECTDKTTLKDFKKIFMRNFMLYKEKYEYPYNSSEHLILLIFGVYYNYGKKVDYKSVLNEVGVIDKKRYIIKEGSCKIIDTEKDRYVPSLFTNTYGKCSNRIKGMTEAALLFTWIMLSFLLVFIYCEFK